MAVFSAAMIFINVGVMQRIDAFQRNLLSPFSSLFFNPFHVLVTSTNLQVNNSFIEFA